MGCASIDPQSNPESVMINPYRAKLAALGLPYRPILGEASAKTVKGQKLNYLTGILYLTPDHELCAHAALAGCMAGCLRTAGRGAFDSVQAARDAKTAFWREHREAFMLSLCADIYALVQRAERMGMIPLVRLNGTSDIPFENIIIETLNHNVFLEFPGVQFYDYTKHPSRNLTGKTANNYDLTYSFSGVTPKAISLKGLSNPWNRRTAVVFSRREDIPSTFRGWPVVDGDDTDVRHIEPERVVVALYAKGKAKHDMGGFVQRPGRDYPVVMMHAA
jgi:hypothetical protein